MGFSSIPPQNDKVAENQQAGNGTFPTGKERDKPFKTVLLKLAKKLGINSIIPLPIGDTSKYYKEEVSKGQFINISHPAPYSNGNITIAPWLVDPYSFTNPEYGSLLSTDEVGQLIQSARQDFKEGTLKDIHPGSRIDVQLSTHITTTVFQAALNRLDKAPKLKKEFSVFLKEEDDWLESYAKAKALSDLVENEGNELLNPDPSDWPEQYQELIRAKNPKPLETIGNPELLKHIKANTWRIKFEQFIAEKAYKAMVLDFAKQGIGVGTDITAGVSKTFTEIYPDAFVRDPQGKTILWGYDGQNWNLPCLDIKSEGGKALIKLKIRRSLKVLKSVQEQLKQEGKKMPPYIVRLDAMQTLYGGLGHIIISDKESTPVLASINKSKEYAWLRKPPYPLIHPHLLDQLWKSGPDGKPLPPTDPGYLKTREEAEITGTLDIYEQLMGKIESAMKQIKDEIKDAHIPEKNVCFELLGPPHYFVDEYGKKARYYMWTQDPGTLDYMIDTPANDDRVACYSSHDKPLMRGKLIEYVKNHSGRPYKERLAMILENLGLINETENAELYYEPIDNYKTLSKSEKDNLLDRLQELEIAAVLNNTNRAQFFLPNLIRVSHPQLHYVEVSEKGHKQQYWQVPGKYDDPTMWAEWFSKEQLDQGMVNMPRIALMVLNAKVAQNKVEESAQIKILQNQLELLSKFSDYKESTQALDENVYTQVTEKLNKMAQGLGFSLLLGG